MIAPLLQLAAWRLPALVLALHLAAVVHGVPVSTLVGVCVRESGCRTTHGRILGVQAAPPGLAQVDAGARLLRRLRDRTGSWRRALCAYRYGGQHECPAGGYVDWVLAGGRGHDAPEAVRP